MTEERLEQNFPQINLVRGKDFRVIFANQLRVRLTNTDIGIVFGFSDDIPPSKSFISEEVMTIMTPAVAKSLAISLTETIKLFEEAYGAIHFPPDRQINAESVQDAVRTAMKPS